MHPDAIGSERDWHKADRTPLIHLNRRSSAPPCAGRFVYILTKFTDGVNII